MALLIAILAFGCRKQRKNRGFLEKGHAQNLVDFAQRSLDGQSLFENRHKKVNAGSDPDLRLDRVGRKTKEPLEAQVLLDPFEEQLHLPAAAIQPSNGQGRQLKIVGQENQALAVVGSDIADATQRVGIVARGLGAMQGNRLIAAQAKLFVDGPREAADIIEVLFGPGDEESRVATEGVQAGEVDVTTVEQIEGTRLAG